MKEREYKDRGRTETVTARKIRVGGGLSGRRWVTAASALLGSGDSAAAPPQGGTTSTL